MSDVDVVIADNCYALVYLLGKLGCPDIISLSLLHFFLFVFLSRRVHLDLKGFIFHV